MNARPFVIAFAATVVLVAAGSFYISQTIDQSTKTVTAVPAPDGKYKAVRVSLSLGSKSAFCADTISIFLTVYPDTFAESDKAYEVYAAFCAPADKRADFPKIEWVSNTELKITYVPPASGEKPPRLRLLDASKFVRVSFVEEK